MAKGKFHINGNHEAKACNARKRACRFGDNDHYENQAEAVKEAERRGKEEQGGSLNNAVSKKKTNDHEDGAEHARDGVESGLDPDKLLNEAIDYRDEWSNGYIEELSKLSKSKASKPKRLTPAQKEREKGKEHAQKALEDGHDADRLLKYANQHDAFAKGYTAELQRVSEEKTTELAKNHFDKNIASTYGDIPTEHLEKLRNQYVDDVLANPKAKEELKKDAKGNAEKPKSNDSSIQRETIDTEASTLRVGDIITGEKFTNSGKWVEDDSAEIVKIEQFTNIDMKTELKVTYDDGHEGILGNSSNVKVKRDKKRILGKEASTTVIRRSVRSATDEAENGYLIKKEDFNKVMKFANQSNANLEFANRLDRLANAMEDNNQHDPSIKASAASTRIKMSYDKNYELDRGEAFDLLYDKDNTDPQLFDKLEKDFPTVAESAARSREMRKEINQQKAERGDTEYA